MLAIERHRRLLDLLQTSGSVRTAEAARALGVTEETVRRDFEKLEAEGTLVRSHGGAVRLELSRREFSEEERAGQNIEAKQRIGRAAVGRIVPGQTILFDASTTAKYLAEILPDQPLTVITSGIRTALILVQKPAIHVILIGGNLHSKSLSCTGGAAEHALDLIRIDAAYISCRGLDVCRGPSEATEEQARLKRKMVESVEEVCLLADASKLGVSSNFYFSHPSDVDVLITDTLPDTEAESSLLAAGVEIVTTGAL
ncbi:MAG: DeoR/GlpR family DNA-binding transcription regulator [Terrimicrobiaceae bacterium]